MTKDKELTRADYVAGIEAARHLLAQHDYRAAERLACSMLCHDPPDDLLPDLRNITSVVRNTCAVLSGYPDFGHKD